MYRILLIIIFNFLMINFSFGQIDQKLLDEVKKRKISSVEEAVYELNRNGISIEQAEEMAQMQGLDLNTFLSNNFGFSQKSKSVSEESLEEVVDTIRVIDEYKEVTIETNDKKNKETLNNDFFGYSIFYNNPFATKDYLVGNIDEGYLLSPGDELRITVYGNNALSTESKIDLNGNIIFPDLGVFQAAGNSLKTLKSRLKIFLGKFYNGLVSSPQQAFLDISLTQIRPVSVNVIGEALTPGPHLINGLASVLNALYSAGGVKTSGSLRKILVYRNNKLLKEFDLYNYITQGNIDSDLRLMNSDIIFIPPRISSVSLKGEVKNSAIFELKEGETLNDLINFSGGLESKASIKNINLSRIVPFENRDKDKVFNRYLTTIDFDSNKELKLLDGDAVEVRSVLAKRLNEVTLQGSVNSEGIYSILKYPDLKSLIQIAGKGISKNTYLEKVDITRVDNQGKKSFKTFNLGEILSDNSNFKLKQDDIVRVYSLEEVQGAEQVSISGFGADEKTIFWRENLSIYDVIFEATSFEELNFQSKLLLSRVDVETFNVQTGKYFTKSYSFNNIIQLKENFLKPKDKIVLYSKSVFKNINPTISVVGGVNMPVTLELNDNMYVEDAILKANGFKKFANTQEVEVIRKLVYSKDNSLSTTFNYMIDEDYFLGLTDSPLNPFTLKDDDIVVIRTPNRDDAIATVFITGEINSPGNYSYENFNTNLKALISKSKGLTEFANLNSTQFFRGDKLLSYRNKNELLKQNLSPGDAIVIGSNLDDVEVSGNGINFPTLSSWENKSRAKYYIRKAGGTKSRIESKVIQRKNGSSKKIKSFLSNPKIFPGDNIVVTQKPEKTKSNESFQDSFVRVLSIITGSLTTILLIDKL